MDKIFPFMFRGEVLTNSNKKGQCKIFVKGIYPDEYRTQPSLLPNAEPAMPLKYAAARVIPNEELGDIPEREIPEKFPTDYKEWFKKFQEDYFTNKKKKSDIKKPTWSPMENMSEEALGEFAEQAGPILDKLMSGLNGILKSNGNILKVPKSLIYSDYTPPEATSGTTRTTINPEEETSPLDNVSLEDLKNLDFSNSTGYCGWPQVGSFVWVFFEGGNHNYPIYFAACPAGTGWISPGTGEHEEDSRGTSFLLDESIFENVDMNTVTQSKDILAKRYDPIQMGLFYLKNKTGISRMSTEDLINRLIIGDFEDISNPLSDMGVDLGTSKLDDLVPLLELEPFEPEIENFDEDQFKLLKDLNKPTMMYVLSEIVTSFVPKPLLKLYKLLQTTDGKFGVGLEEFFPEESPEGGGE